MEYYFSTEPPEKFHPKLDVVGCYCGFGNKILLLKRHPNKPQGDTWGVPAGKAEKDEDLRTAVVREVMEEVGLKVDSPDLKNIGKLYCRLPHIDYVYHMFHKNFKDLPEVDLGLEEHLESRWVTIEEALALPLIAGGKEALSHYITLTNR